MILKYFEIISWYQHHTNSISSKISKYTPSAVDTICFFLLETSLSCYELKTRIWKPEIERYICHILLKTSIRCNDDTFFWILIEREYQNYTKQWKYLPNFTKFLTCKPIMQRDSIQLQKIKPTRKEFQILSGKTINSSISRNYSIRVCILEFPSFFAPYYWCQIHRTKSGNMTYKVTN